MARPSNDFSDNRDFNGGRARNAAVPASDFADFLDKTGAIFIGVTGRRHIVPEARPAVESAARAALRTLVAASDRRPIYVATGLAIGADQLAAKLVLEAKAEAAARGASSPLRLVALLPMSVAEYSSDFSTNPGSGATASTSELDDFNAYLASSDVVVEIEPTADNAERARCGAAFDRMAQYAALGDFLVERSRLLWAFWSGDASNVKRGGTADVVLRKSRRISNGAAFKSNVFRASESNDAGLVDFSVSEGFSGCKASNDFNVSGAFDSSDLNGSNVFSFGNPFQVDVLDAFASSGFFESNAKPEFSASCACDFEVSSDFVGFKGGNVGLSRNFAGGWSFEHSNSDGFSGEEAICCVGTPEVLRVKNADGTKTRVPESTENAGKIAFWTRSNAGAAFPSFEPAEVALASLTRFWKALCVRTK